MMLVYEVLNAIYSDLRVLEKRRYLCAMWNVCTELQSLYREQSLVDERALMSSTLSLIREVVINGEMGSDTARIAAAHYEQWDSIRTEERSGLPGQANARFVFRDLAGEIAGMAPIYEATERLDMVAADRWRSGGLIWDDPNEEVSDTSPMAQTLTFLSRAVTEVSALPDAWLRARNWDPKSVQDELIGPPPVFPGEPPL